MPDQTLMLRYPRIQDLIPRARRRIPAFAWGYLNHGQGRETLLDGNISAFDRVRLGQNVLHDQGAPDPGTEFLGQRHAFPFGIAPVGLTSMMWPDGERIFARVASDTDIPMALSCVANARLEDIAPLASNGLWFQLYVLEDPEARRDLVRRAEAAGIETLVLTVDVPVTSRRELASVSGLPPRGRLTPRMIAQSLRCPDWGLRSLRRGRPDFISFRPYVPECASFTDLGDFAARNLGRRVTPTEIEEIRALWPGKLIIKGVLSREDARRALELGADALWVSNHGGRQNDAVLPSLDALVAIRDELPETPLILDSGVRSGLDVLRALRVGADFVFLGRSWFYGLGAIGPRGAQHVADILAAELVHAMRQLGVPDLRRETLNGLDLFMSAPSS